MASRGQEKVLLVPLFFMSYTFALCQVIKLHLVLRARKGEKQKVTLGQSLQAPPSPGHLAPGDCRATAVWEIPGRWGEAAASTSAGEGSTRDPCSSFPWLFGSGKSSCTFPRWPSFLGSLAASGCGCSAWERQLRGRRCCAMVCRHKAQHPAQSRQRESEQTTLPEAQRVGAQ